MAMDNETPVLVSSAMEWMHARSDRFAVIVMDGMSEFDWRVIRESFGGVAYEHSGAPAILPMHALVHVQDHVRSVVAAPRQLLVIIAQIGHTLLADAPSSHAGEKLALLLAGSPGFIQVAWELTGKQALPRERGHRGHHGKRSGLLKDMELLRDGGKLVELVRRLLDAGMDVYITADHGNTPCVGRGRVTGTGVETETKGKRMYVANDLTDVSALRDKYELIECPAAFLPQGLKYYVCPSGVSFDNPGEHVMSHGGMSLDEVVVPFISIRSESA